MKILNMKLSKRFIGRGVIALLAAAVLTGGAFAADDPLKGNYTVYPKERVTALTANGSNTCAFYNFTDANGSPLSSAQQLGGTTLRGDPVVTVAAVAGYVNDTGTANNDFYGTLLPEGKVVAAAYLESSGNITFTLLDQNGNYLANGFPVGLGVPVVTVSKACAYFSLVANDWNNDGYSDYILSYPTFDGTVGDANSQGTLTVTSVYIDGLTCYTAAKDKPSDWPRIGVARTLFSDSSWGDAFFNVSSAVGDLDGDGIKEFIIYYSAYPTYSTDPMNYYYNYLDAYSIVPSASDVAFNRTLHFDEGISYWGNDEPDAVLAVAAGDFDGDGKDQVAMIYNLGDSMYLNLSHIDAYRSTSVSVRPRPTHNASKLTALAADLDGDGRDELIWDYCVNDNASPNLHIHTWPSNTWPSTNFSTTNA